MTDANCMTVVTDPANHAMQYSYDTENNLPFDPLITKTKLGALLFAYFAKGGYRTADGERF